MSETQHVSVTALRVLLRKLGVRSAIKGTFITVVMEPNGSLDTRYSLVAHPSPRPGEIEIATYETLDGPWNYGI